MDGADAGSRLTRPVPLADVGAQQESLRAAFHALLDRVLDTQAFLDGQLVDGFERRFAGYCGAGHAIGVANGVDALWLALRAAGVQAGDEVITVAEASTVDAILRVGARPRLVDVHTDTGTMDTDAAGDAVTARTVALVPVHVYGQPADMDPLVALARRQGLAVIEDARQAHGATYHRRRVGSLGDLACFSFHPEHNLGALGGGGAVTTGSAELAAAVRALTVSAGPDASRLDTFQAGVLSLKLDRLDGWNELRRQHAARYRENIGQGDAIRLPAEPGYARGVYRQFVVRVAERDRVRADLRAAGITTAAGDQLQYAPSARRGELPATEDWARQAVALPMFPDLTAEQVDRVSAAVLSASRSPVTSASEERSPVTPPSATGTSLAVCPV